MPSLGEFMGDMGHSLDYGDGGFASEELQTDHSDSEDVLEAGGRSSSTHMSGENHQLKMRCDCNEVS